MAVTSSEIALGTPAPDFDLPDLAGGRIGLDSLKASDVLVVLFVCNHCPYVRHIEAELPRIARDFITRGVALVAICSNDPIAYPDDNVAGMREQVDRAGWDFPYLIDETQEVARSYGAVCTPDIFVFDSDRKLAYHGALDESTPRNDVPATGALLRGALEQVTNQQPVPLPHRPAMGCSIKWRGEQ